MVSGMEKLREHLSPALTKPGFLFWLPRMESLYIRKPVPPKNSVRLVVLAPVAVDRSPSAPRSWRNDRSRAPVHLSNERDRRGGVRNARVR